MKLSPHLPLLFVLTHAAVTVALMCMLSDWHLLSWRYASLWAFATFCYYGGALSARLDVQARDRGVGP